MSSVYKKILEKWSPLLTKFQICDNINVVSNVDLYKAAADDMKRNVEHLQGENSTIHELRLNDNRVFILKKESRHGHSIRGEAEMQQYVTAKHAPIVYAFDNTKILMEKCIPLTIQKHETFGLVEGSIKLHKYREKIYHFNAISRALNYQRQSILVRTAALYDEFGLFSEDVHTGNFLQRLQPQEEPTIVHIDFDEMKFKSTEKYKTFQKQYPGHTEERIIQDTPQDPPYYYWWADSIFSESNQKTWKRSDWLKEIINMKQQYNSIKKEIQTKIKKGKEEMQGRVKKRVEDANKENTTTANTQPAVYRQYNVLVYEKKTNLN